MNTTIDRSACAARLHGTKHAYDRHRCRCADAKECVRLHWRRVRVRQRGVRLVSPQGTIRRLQALAVAGWSSSEIAKRLGISGNGVNTLRYGNRQGRPNETVHLTTARRVAAVYQELAHLEGPSEHTRRHAERAGWLGADAWFDIDHDPDGGIDRIVVERALLGKCCWRDLDQGHQLAVVREARRRGVSWESLGRLLGCHTSTPQQAWNRHGWREVELVAAA